MYLFCLPSLSGALVLDMIIRADDVSQHLGLAIHGREFSSVVSCGMPSEHINTRLLIKTRFTWGKVPLQPSY
ncbi:hypothetical protein GGR50DRAFT_215684 [Xylaria sp. CBS 124048]|nr:hypothetical protein GGR50DRAFT_215684 [Xylaria sp. CBS 124048]